jgi:hypothetical protein
MSAPLLSLVGDGGAGSWAVGRGDGFLVGAAVVARAVVEGAVVGEVVVAGGAVVAGAVADGVAVVADALGESLLCDEPELPQPVASTAIATAPEAATAAARIAEGRPAVRPPVRPLRTLRPRSSLCPRCPACVVLGMPTPSPSIRPRCRWEQAPL